MKIIRKISSLAVSLALSANIFGGLSLQAASHTFEDNMTKEQYENILERYRDSWYIGEDGVIYAKEDVLICSAYVPNAGTFDRADLLLALIDKYPEGRFAVILESWAECKTAQMPTGELIHVLNEDDKIRYEEKLTVMSEQDSGLRTREEIYLRENGIDFIDILDSQVCYRKKICCSDR